MASGKSLELAQIKPQRLIKCICGEPFVAHMRKDGKGLLKKYDNPNHEAMIHAMVPNRKMRRYRG